MRPQRFRKKSIEIEAMRWTGDNVTDMLAFTGQGNFLTIRSRGRPGEPDFTAELYVNANDRWLPIKDGEWIAKDCHGFYPIKADIFDAWYEAVQS